MNDLSEYLRKFAHKRIAVVGDLMLDRYVFGEVERISPEAPIPVLKVEREEDRPGGGANVVLNLRSLGAQVDLYGVVGRDDRGDRLRELLGAGVETIGVLEDPERPTTSKTRVVARQQQIVRVDRESSEPISDDTTDALLELLEARLSQVDALILSDYGKGVIAQRLVERVVEVARRHSIPVFVDPKGRDFSKYRGATVLTPNERELESATAVAHAGGGSLKRAAQELFSRTDIPWIVATRGAEGSALFHREEGVEWVPTEPVEVVDVTGAGDTFLSVLALAWVSGASPLEAAQLATIAGTAVVQRFGAVSITPNELAEKIAAKRGPAGSKVVTTKQLRPLLSELRSRGKKVVFTNGCFDLLHVGHVQYLKAAKRKGDILVLGVNSDASVRSLKGDGRPLIPEQERIEILAALHCVDYIVLFHEATPERLIGEIRPDVLVKGADYRLEEVVGREIVEGYGGRVELIPLVENRSTSKLIKTIVERWSPPKR